MAGVARAVADAARRGSSVDGCTVYVTHYPCINCAKILAAAGVRVMTDTFVARLARGAGRFAPDKMMYFGEMALADLEGVDLMVLVETAMPVSFFAYPDKPSELTPEGCRTSVLATRARVADVPVYIDGVGTARPAAAVTPVPTPRTMRPGNIAPSVPTACATMEGW